jgi:hypothetical protein
VATDEHEQPWSAGERPLIAQPPSGWDTAMQSISEKMIIKSFHMHFEIVVYVTNIDCIPDENESAP